LEQGVYGDVPRGVDSQNQCGWSKAAHGGECVEPAEAPWVPVEPSVLAATPTHRLPMAVLLARRRQQAVGKHERSRAQATFASPDALPPTVLVKKAHAVTEGAHEGEAFVTVMIRNLPPAVKRRDLVGALDDTGFGGMYDFVYVPSCFTTGASKCFAFVNFDSQAAASGFAASWHGSHRFGAPRTEPAINVSAAAIQGLEANLAKWHTTRMRRIRNPELRPYVREGKGPGKAGSLAAKSPPFPMPR